MAGRKPFLRIPNVVFAAVLVLAFVLGALFSKNVSAETNVILIIDAGHGGSDRGGYDGRGFKLDGARIPEDAYTYDVAKRLERLAVSRGWKAALTTIDGKNETISNKDGQPPPSKKNLVYNFGKRKTAVFAGRDGLLKRLEATKAIAAENKNAETIFISVHFDHASRFLSGVQVFSAAKTNKHPFVKILAEEFRKNGLELKFGPIPRPMINWRNELVVLAEGKITPSVLVELGNFQNERDRALMLSKEGREKYAEIIAAAVGKYLENRGRQKTKD